ncbi:MAG: hypothetical protein LCH38_08935 [Proteobacteria bacterium]|nr:hypothetical protein [Pseudomonadota bacterium]
MSATTNPFPNDPDRGAIWTMLVQRDIDAFIGQDWAMVEGDFVAEGFLGIDAKASENPDTWRIGFPSLQVYRDEWLRQSAATAATKFAEDARLAIYRATNLLHIDVTGDIAVAHKKFDGSIAKADGTKDVLNWQTLYFCRKAGGHWKLTGFIGYMPFPMGRRAG